MKALPIRIAMAAAIAVAGFTASALAGELPANVIWTAYGTTSSGYAQSVAIGNMLKNRHGTTLAVKPGKNDISRMTPLKQGKVGYCACGIASYFGAEGVALFASAAWDDVEKVEFSGFGASWDGMVNGQVDAAFSSTPSPVTKKLAASPRGVHWPTLPHNDAAAWKRFLTAAPYFVKHNATVGTGMSKDNPWEGATYAYPILVTNASYDADVVYSLVKAMVEGYEDYGGTVPGSKGWALQSQGFEWVLPYHEGAIRYFKEVGAWSDAAQANTDALIERQGAIADAWAAFTAASPPEDKGAFKTAWMAARAKALEGAGLNPIFK